MPNQYDFKGLTDFFHVFQSGQQTDSRGRTRTFTNAELDKIAENTNKKIQEDGLFAVAPFVVGHPKHNDPSFGWVAGVKREGDTLLVKGDKVHEQFASGVKDGLWPNRSIRLGKDDNGFFLKHIGFLGAAPPAVEGMESVYAGDEGEYFDYDVGDYAVDTYTPNVLARTMRRVRDFIIDKFDIETADKIIPDYEIDVMNDHVNSLRDDPETTPTSNSFNKNDHQGDNTMPPEFTQADIDAAKEQGAKEAREKSESDFSAKETELNDKLETERRQRLSAEFSADITDLVGEGKLTPAQAEGMADFMLTLSDADDDQFEFSAGDGDKKQTIKKAPLDWFREFAKSIGKQVDLGESDAGDGSQHEASAGDFIAAHGQSVDADRLGIHTKALDYQAKHDGVEYIDAVRLVEQQEG